MTAPDFAVWRPDLGVPDAVPVTVRFLETVPDRQDLPDTVALGFVPLGEGGRVVARRASRCGGDRFLVWLPIGRWEVRSLPSPVEPMGLGHGAFVRLVDGDVVTVEDQGGSVVVSLHPRWWRCSWLVLDEDGLPFPLRLALARPDAPWQGVTSRAAARHWFEGDPELPVAVLGTPDPVTRRPLVLAEARPFAAWPSAGGAPFLVVDHDDVLPVMMR